MILAARGTTDEHPLLLATLPPSGRQGRLAFAILVGFVITFCITVPFANTPLPRLDPWVPTFTTTLVITDFITSVLLFSQFAIARQRALLVLAVGYLFSTLIIIPYALTFPGVFAPTGLLGAGLQSAVWFYVVWHITSPSSVIIYELLKDTRNTTTEPRKNVGFDIGLSVVLAIGTVCALTWLFTAQHDILPSIYLDNSRLSPLAKVAGGLISLLCTIALALLWFRRSSVLDLWLMVTVSAWLLEITLNGVFLTDRFSLAWYMGRIFSLISGSIVLTMLLSEMATLYAHLARSAMRRRAASQARQIVMDTMAASIAHELNQPLGAISLNAETALLLLARTPPDHEEAKAALEDIALSAARGTQVIASLRAMFKKSAHVRASFDANDLIHESLAMLDIDLQAQHILVSTELGAGLPPLVADRSQLQQVFLNLIMNAIEAMRPITDRARSLRIASGLNPESTEMLITIEDTGSGINKQAQDRIFEPFFTTKSSGTGIGLTICRSIIDSHGGSLRASANNPHGTILEVVLPIESGSGG